MVFDFEWFCLISNKGVNSLGLAALPHINNWFTFPVIVIFHLSLMYWFTVCHVASFIHHKSSHRRCSARKDVLRNFAKFTGKQLRQGLTVANTEIKGFALTIYTMFTSHDIYHDITILWSILSFYHHFIILTQSLKVILIVITERHPNVKHCYRIM